MSFRKGFVVLALLTIPYICRADGPVLTEDQDTVVVHHLAHFGAGTLVAAVPDFILTRFDSKSWEHAWSTRLIVDCLVAAAATDLYEMQTQKVTKWGKELKYFILPMASALMKVGHSTSAAPKSFRQRRQGIDMDRKSSKRSPL